ncbi:hypothetical protein [Legionella bozemanae]|uniref:hypothetical protein n=1 Tax=Legionella bozemanae TaxID=447 RepID=UPI001041952B|nr:hypothetical protein [Legionella bozemanae]
MKLLDTLFCEDIRFEQNNKLSLMGLYSDQIVFILNETEIKWPISTNLALLLRFKKEHNEKLPNLFVFEYFLKDKLLAEIKGEIRIDENQSTFSLALLTPQLPVEPGYIAFKINLYDRENVLFSFENNKAIKIALRQPA